MGIGFGNIFSGKTLSFAIPILHGILLEHEMEANEAENEEDVSENDSEDEITLEDGEDDNDDVTVSF